MRSGFARGPNRTGTDLAALRILSPVRLPVPPHELGSRQNLGISKRLTLIQMDNLVESQLLKCNLPSHSLLSVSNYKDRPRIH